MFKLFYSWQSDLPSSKTRSFIRSCIDEAIELAQDSEAIEAVRDEATLGTTGSPDIVSTLFSKIDECDLFVADVSLCFTEDGDGKKRSPNPNVMLEMGYAVKTLGWERVICLCNTDFGDDFPFDFDHNRRTGYSLEGKNKEAEKYGIAKIIFSNIRDLRNAPPRSKGGMATHILGTYDFEQKKVTSVLVPLKIKEQESYILHNQELIMDSRKLVDEIRDIKINEELPEDAGTVEKQADEDPLKAYVHLTAESFIKQETPVRIDVENERENIKKWLDIDVDDEFFNCGVLKQRIQLLGGHEELIGTEEAKEKYHKLTILFYYLTQLELRNMYLKTFKGMSYLPIAIQNNSNVTDSDIRVVIHVVGAEILNPSENLIYSELEGLQGHLCRDEDENSGVGIIDELFLPFEDGNIHIEEAKFNPANFRMKTPVITPRGLQYPDKDEKDYKEELSEYIATATGSDYYEFEVDSLRPGECKWLSRGILVRVKSGEPSLQYQIHSARSNGELAGKLTIQ